ncbi:Ferrous-iron efflux pump FieF [Sporomusa silvacetica DSM 10669]|uniref:Ferrous-iron efflux pump FieF n=1 Tax=Sporomusa silvacetica DSM 10669 TaxID=1123289 RepID=A0ABZ3ILZ9_9FIRM|nr:cation diffusion facilitator family transporter [Sporomusa silvacetica]OZC23283.1 ferrous-iron efflux pump FieF [Sporomusa silvacetica DSM 10669]
MNKTFDGSKKSAARVSVMSNSVLVLTKLVVGVFTGSVSVISEAAHSAVDLLAALIAYFAVSNSDKKPDIKHTYGHGKIENLSGAVEALLIIAAAIWIVFEAVQKFSTNEAPKALEYGIVIMVVSIFVNYFVSRNLFKVAKSTQSHALEADALHLQADIWTSIGVLVGLVTIKFTGLYWLDSVIAIVVAVIIFKTGYDMTIKSMHELIDVALPDEERMIIQKVIENHPEVKGYKHIHSRRSGSKRLIDLYIMLEGDLSFKQAHSICDEVEAEIKSIFSPCEVTIHPEPFFESE